MSRDDANATRQLQTLVLMEDEQTTESVVVKVVVTIAVAAVAVVAVEVVVTIATVVAVVVATIATVIAVEVVVTIAAAAAVAVEVVTVADYRYKRRKKLDGRFKNQRNNFLEDIGKSVREREV
ncbi:hypothetical protein ElyMa_000123600 [Elysia marginata]|uniref:Uncharacterized protein n=1 Tax=Elysia marginata TaxID=1093978 RepID=A0AAV4ENS2_9GAST|nr:hypothetical protein ElyMa_000123600 [Elysia marginata]